jgi:predicted acetyltransferase
MGPLQIVRLMLQAKRYNRAGLISIGVLDSQRGKHIGHTLAATLYRRYEELGLGGALYYPVNDHNLASRRFAESFGAEDGSSTTLTTSRSPDLRHQRCGRAAQSPRAGAARARSLEGR